MKSGEQKSSKIRLPDWLTDKSVFQQNVAFEITGTAPAMATVTFEIVKSPTDGRRISKLDTDYGIILSRETTTGAKGEFTFTVPDYKASADAYTFIFRCLSEEVTVSDIRCGDVWVFLGSEFLSVPMKEANAPSAPLKRRVMSYLRFYLPGEGEEGGSWYKVTDTKPMADVSSSAFAFAYSLANQISYPVGVIDLARADSTILNWLSRDAVDNMVAVRDYLAGIGLYLDEERYNAILAEDRKRNSKERLEEEVEEGKKLLDFDLAKDKELKELKGEESDEEQVEQAKSLDFPSSEGSALKTAEEGDNVLKASAAKLLDFSMLPAVKAEKEEEKEEIDYIKTEFRMTALYEQLLTPLTGVPVRGFCFSPNREELVFERYDLLLMGLLTSLAMTFEPSEVYDDSLMPSIIFVAMHPDNIDFENPYGVLEFNEVIQAFMHKLDMKSGLIGTHDLLLPDKTVSFVIGQRMAQIALGTHFTPKLPTSCPQLTGVEKAGNKLILRFDNLADGLRLSDGYSELLGFAVCGPDRVFCPASARILHGVRVMVWSDAVEDPVSVTYGFCPIPHEATFRNLCDLPVLPFRFDRRPAFYCPDLSFTSCDRLEFIGKREKDSKFEILDVFRTFKGNGVITTEPMNKTQGAASLHIRYETDNSLYGFEPVLSYASLFAPLDIRGRNKMAVDVFNPEQRRKKMVVENFGECEIRQDLTWQTMVFEYKGEGHISIDSLKFQIEDQERSGEIYIDNIRFISGG
ncbi:protein of unknown function [Ruminococcaceae bacterium YRB3002]|nr:protein of unknown function [Ruminococcaceae bacterium YRB3002]